MGILTMAEKFNLKWNDFHSNVSKSFSLFRNEEYLHDVTLVSDDQSKVLAHKLVLSACSEYFRNIFKNNQHSHPLICLDGISSEDIKNITDYIYNGEVMIFQESIDRFLAVAQRLKLEGLMTRDMKVEEEEKRNSNTNDYDAIRMFEEVAENYEPDPSPKVEQRVPQIDTTLKSNVVVAVNSDDIKEINEKIAGYLEECIDGSFQCSLCGKTSAVNMRKSVQKRIIQRHIESHMSGLIYTCPVCQKTFRSSHSLTVHKNKYH